MMRKGAKNPNAGRKLFDGKPVETVLQLLRQAWAMGCRDCEAAALADISPSALSAYLAKNPKISEEKEKLLNKPFLAARNCIMRAIADGDKDTARWYMERKLKKEFSTLQQVEVSEQGQYRELTDDQLAQIAAGKATPADFLK